MFTFILKITVLTLSDVLARLAQSVRPLRIHRFLPKSRWVTRSNPIIVFFSFWPFNLHAIIVI